MFKYISTLEDKLPEEESNLVSIVTFKIPFQYIKLFLAVGGVVIFVNHFVLFRGFNTYVSSTKVAVEKDLL